MDGKIGVHHAGRQSDLIGVVPSGSRFAPFDLAGAQVCAPYLPSLFRSCDSPGIASASVGRPLVRWGALIVLNRIHSSKDRTI